MRINTIRFKLLFSFFIFLLITIGIVLLSLWFQVKEDNNQKVLNTLYQINLDNETTLRLERDFLKDEVINPEFYDRGRSKLLREREQKLTAIKNKLSYLKGLLIAKNINLVQPIENLIDNFRRYKKDYKELVAFIKRRGFEDYGLEGTMREYIHELEDLSEKYKLDLAKLLMIRRHEKDYILRKQTKYIEKIKLAVDVFQEEIENKVRAVDKQERLLRILNKYRESFITLTVVEEKIGITNKYGLRAELNTLAKDIHQNVSEINIKIKENILRLEAQRHFIFVSVIVFAISLIVFLSFYISRILSQPIRQLSHSIEEVIASNFSKEVEVSEIRSRDEMGRLARDFRLMLEKVQSSIEVIRRNSERIQKKQKLLMDSVRYAQKIQNALLPDELILREFFDDFFIIYRPMHIVSGDFYWVAEQSDRVLVALVDCTGHGVPGAFMGMIGNAILNKIIKEKGINDPDFILEILDMEVRTLLNQEKTGNDDGMDLSLCVIENLKTESEIVNLRFSGAKSSIFYSEGGKIQKVKGTSRAIGGSVKPRINRSFEVKKLSIRKGEILYLSTDGFFDQPNSQRKKYGKKRFINCLESQQTASLDEQKTALVEDLNQHSPEKIAQRDDITVLGIRL